jgi:hypothetical protein
VIGLILLWIGRPNKDGLSPSFLRFEQAVTFYPVTVVTFIAIGMATLISGFSAGTP